MCPSGSCPVDGRTVLQGALALCPSSGEQVAPGAVLIAEQMAHRAHLLCESCCSSLRSEGLSESFGLKSSVGPGPSPGTQWAGSISATNRQGADRVCEHCPCCKKAKLLVGGGAGHAGGLHIAQPVHH